MTWNSLSLFNAIFGSEDFLNAFIVKDICVVSSGENKRCRQVFMKCEVFIPLKVLIRLIY